LRSDLFGTRASEYQRRVEAQSRQQTFAAAENAMAGAPAGAAAPARPTAPAPSPAPPPAANSQASPASAAGSGTGDAHTRPTRIHITSGPKRGAEVALGDEPLTIGRAPDSSLVIQDDYTSTRHARVERSGSSWRIVDLDSTNGTYLAGNRVDGAAPLSPGTPVRIGTTTFELR
ncbi:MAG: FHA domain-containing protein FhaB/FipA, partial [Pseudoclavibacter sp.]